MKIFMLSTYIQENSGRRRKFSDNIEILGLWIYNCWLDIISRKTE